MNIHKLGLFVCAMVLTGCASSQLAAANQECTRADAAARFAVSPFRAIPAMTNDCFKTGNPLACNPANAPMAALVGIMLAPVLFPIGLSSKQIHSYHCGTGTTQRKR